MGKRQASSGEAMCRQRVNTMKPVANVSRVKLTMRVLKKFEGNSGGQERRRLRSLILEPPEMIRFRNGTRASVMIYDDVGAGRISFSQQIARDTGSSVGTIRSTNLDGQGRWQDAVRRWRAAAVRVTQNVSETGGADFADFRTGESHLQIQSVCLYQLTEKLRKFILKKILKTPEKIFRRGIGKRLTLSLHLPHLLRRFLMIKLWAGE